LALLKAAGARLPESSEPAPDLGGRETQLVGHRDGEEGVVDLAIAGKIDKKYLLAAMQLHEEFPGPPGAAHIESHEIGLIY
jgi:hypothetical protein